ncbi:hypothetical protein Isop_2312 [Isosphaera pallida ATCC 43644]|jgi:rRNA maturation protein Nop10|uniref:Uncharacterized protein n=1 Tax=Isosphaera pallida (strain ATCC 43644 / DSM 9630 / IS1B) TaxID=575540 RepID=E8R6H9_ISOPI|nr:hypothetical protein [Isosphaera pallida]ADV62890.1 hypothetical protein Isop_2312 [Isosphaera pallida ATCC 43644]
MSPARTLPTRLLVQISVIPIPEEGIVEGSCPHCGGAIQFHEPQPSVPERLLGTCERCGAWTLYEEVAGRGEALVIPLPRIGEVASSQGANPSILKTNKPAQSASGFGPGETGSSGENEAVSSSEAVETLPGVAATDPTDDSNTSLTQDQLQAGWIETLQPDWTGRAEGVSQWHRALPVVPGWVEWASPGGSRDSWHEASGEFDLQGSGLNLEETTSSGEFDSWVGVL